MGLITISATTRSTSIPGILTLLLEHSPSPSPTYRSSPSLLIPLFISFSCHSISLLISTSQFLKLSILFSYKFFSTHGCNEKISRWYWPVWTPHPAIWNSRHSLLMLCHTHKAQMLHGRYPNTYTPHMLL